MIKINSGNLLMRFLPEKIPQTYPDAPYAGGYGHRYPDAVEAHVCP
jgi:hypothetical protein